MTSDRRVYLHIGMPKTGTTYLQDAIWQHRDALEERGLYVPGVRRQHLLASLDLRGESSLSKRPRLVEHPWRYLVSQIHEQPHNALISHEFFCPASAEQVAQAVDAFPDSEVHVILTARGVVDLFLSRWQEWIKNGAFRPIDGYPRPNPHPSWGWSTIDPGEVLRTWGSVIPRERIHVVPMRSGNTDPEDLWHRFLDVVEISADGLTPEPAGANQSLGIVEVEVLRKVNRRLRRAEGFASPRDRGRWIRGRLAENTIRGLGRSEKFRPGEEKLQELLAREEKLIESLETGGFDLRGGLFQLRSADVSERRHPSDVAAEETTWVSALVIAKLMEDLRSAVVAATTSADDDESEDSDLGDSDADS